MNQPRITDVIVIARATSKSGSEDTLLKALRDVAAPTRAQPGCVEFTLYRSAENPAVITAIERWSSKADHAHHLTGAHVTRLMTAMGPILAEPPDIVVHEVIE